jgi:Ca2+/H+ antiporter
VIEIVTMAGAAVVASVFVWNGRSRRRDGALLVGAYGVAVVAYYLS